MKIFFKLYIAILLFACHSISGASFKVYVICDSKEYDKSKLKEVINNIYFSNKLAISEFKVFHLTTLSESSEKWMDGKKVVYYTPQSIRCDYKKCDKLNELADLFQSERTKLFFCGEYEKCDFTTRNLEISLLTNFEENKIYKLIKEEEKITKKTKEDMSLIFYISGKIELMKSKLNFPIDSALIESGKSFELSNVSNSNFENFNWLPNIGVDCKSCQRIIINPKASVNYTIVATDKFGCESEPYFFKAKVKTKCNNLGEPKLVFEENGKLTSNKYKKTEKKDEKKIKYKWSLSPNQSGSYYYDIITKSNCCDKFVLRIRDKKNNSIWESSYLREDVDERASFQIHKTDKNKFVFRLDLSSIQNVINESESDDYWIIEIECNDEDHHDYKIYNSFEVSFQKC